MKTTINALVLITIILCMLAGCEHSPTSLPVAYQKGNCVGRICDKAGAPVKDATVLLVPEGYAPMQSDVNNTGADSTVSDASGHFSFNVAHSGKFNLLASDNRQYALRKSIPLSTTGQVELPDEKLLEPGSLTGSVNLQGMNDHRAAIILFLGTNRYATPSDVAGNFSVPALAEGTYELRVLSTESSFSVAETTITISSGITTALPPVVLTKKRIPQISSFTVDYDSLMMEAKVSWTTDDTAEIDSFFIYCNREKNILPVKAVGNESTSVTFDLILPPTGTYTYQIAAVDKDGWEGEPVVGKPITNVSAISVREQSFPAIMEGNLYRADSYGYFTQFGFYYCNDTVLQKLSTDFSIESEIRLPGELVYNNTTKIETDGYGNLYLLLYANDKQVVNLVKFDPDCNVIAESKFSNDTTIAYFSFAISATGSVILYGAANSPFTSSNNPIDRTVITIFDPALHHVSDTIIDESQAILGSAASGDTVLAVIGSNAWIGKRAIQYNASFTTAHIIIDMSDNLDVPVPTGCLLREGLIPCANNLFMNTSTRRVYEVPSDLSTFVFYVLNFTDSKNTIIARYPCRGMSPDRFIRGNNGSLYFFRTSDNSCLQFSIDKVIAAAGN